MPLIHLVTYINAPIERVFDLSRSIDLHQQSMHHTDELAIAGKTNGLIGKGEKVTWEARHLLKKRKLTTRIVALQPYTYFRDDMVKGDFKTMIHKHHFSREDATTVMTDNFYFESPYGIIGQVVDRLFLTRYMKQLLITRNRIIKQYAETDQWKTVLHDQ